MAPARPQAARQQKAALNVGTAASKGGGTGSAQQDKAPFSPSPSKRKPPRERQSPATSETREPTQKKTKKTNPDSANFASVTSILQSDTPGEMESAAGEDESGIAGHKDAGKEDVGKEMESAAGEDESGIAGQEDAGKEDEGEEDAGKEDAGKEDAGKEDAGSSPDSDDDIQNPRKRTISKKTLNCGSSDDDSEIAKGKCQSATSGNSYHLIIFN